MSQVRTILVVSDIHYAGDQEKLRDAYEYRIIQNRLLRLGVRTFRHFIWLRDPFAHNHLLDAVLKRDVAPDLVVANGDYSCDSAFVGVSDDAAFDSARICLGKLRSQFGEKLRCVYGDHELGKMSLFGGRGGLRLQSWRRAQAELRLAPFWQTFIGRYVLMGVTSSLLAFPVYEPEALPEERERWREIREEHLAEIRSAFAALDSSHRVLLFCHDPTALPYLWQDESIRSRLAQVEQTIIGHLHSNLFLWQSRALAGMPAINFLGNSVRRMSQALNRARYWPEFRVRLCPSLAGIELLKDGGYFEVDVCEDACLPASFRFHRITNRGQP